MKINIEESIYEIKTTSKFNKNLKRVIKQNKDVEKLIKVVERLANNQTLDSKYKNHKLINDKNFKDCNECHIEPDWLLIYRIENNELILLLLVTGSHSDLFNM